MKKLLPLLLILVSCETELPNDVFIDTRDGKHYETVQIGDQIWMAENLAYLSSDFYVSADGDILYTWTAARIACPKGWHIPTEDEWMELIANLGSESGTNLKEGEFNADKDGWYQSEYSSNNRIVAWWSNTECFKTYAWVFYVNDQPHVFKTNLPKQCKLTVRCVKDQ